MDTRRSASLSFAVVLGTFLLTASCFAQAVPPRRASALSGNPALPWAFGVQVPLTLASPPAEMQTTPALSPWTRTTNNPPVNLGTTLLLTDGTVIAHEENDQNNNVATLAWYKLTPDINGSYINGTWSQIVTVLDSSIIWIRF